MKVREVKDWYVDYLSEMMTDEKNDHEDLTSPLLVLASVSKEDFHNKSLDKYSYQVQCMHKLSLEVTGMLSSLKKMNF